MCEVDELETVTPPLPAAVYRALWLDAADELGLIAEILADMLGWERSAEEPLPDPLELAGVAANRIVELEGQAAGDVAHRGPRNPSGKTRARRTPIGVIRVV